MDLISTLVIVVIAMWAGWHLRGIILLARFSSDPQHFINILQQIKKINEQETKEETSDSSGTELAIERHGDMLYAFIKDTDQFVAQGPSLAEVLNEAEKRYPNRKFFGNISKDNPAKELV